MSQLPLDLLVLPSGQVGLNQELPLAGASWTPCVLSQIAIVQWNPKGWRGGERIKDEAIARDQIMLFFILQNGLIPFTTEQVFRWLDWYGYRIQNDEGHEIRFHGDVWFYVDVMIKGTGDLVDFLFEDVHLFRAQVSAADGTMEEMSFTFVSNNKIEMLTRGSRRKRRERKPKGLGSVPATNETQVQAEDEGDLVRNEDENASIATDELLDRLGSSESGE